jgi:hypothetical protein
MVLSTSPILKNACIGLKPLFDLKDTARNMNLNVALSYRGPDLQSSIRTAI